MRGTALALELVIAAALFALLLLLTTTPGLQLACALLQDASGGSLSIGAADGRLLGRIELRDLRWRDRDGTQVRIGHLMMRWRPRELLAGRLHAGQLQVDALAVDLPAPPAQAGQASPKLPTTLPLDLVIDALNLRGFTLREGGRTAFALDQATLGGQWIGNRVEIPRLLAALPQTGPLELRAKAQLAPESVQLETLQVAGPGRLDVSGRLGIGATDSDLSLHWQDLRWPLTARGDGPTEASAVSGSGQLQGRPQAYRVQLQSLATVHGLPIALALSGSGDTGSVTVDRLSVDTRTPKARQQGQARLQGRVTWAPALTADLDLQLRSLDPGLFARQWNGSLNGQASTHTRWIDGRPQVAFELQLTPSRLRGYPLQLRAAGRGDARGVQLDSLLLQAAGGSVKGQGRLAWSPALDTDLRLDLAGLDPGVFAPAWPGHLSGRLTFKTAAEGGTTAIDAYLWQSQLRGYPLSLEARASLHNPEPPDRCGAPGPCGYRLDLAQLSLHDGSSLLKASGQALPPFDLQGSLDSPDLAALYPGLAGQGRLQFRLLGTPSEPHLVSRGQAQHLAYGRWQIGSLSWNADADPAQPSKIDLEADDAELGLPVKRITVSVDGIEVYHRARIDLDSEYGTLSTTLQGGYDRKRREWGGELAALRIAPAQLQAWSLDKPMGILLGGERFSVEPGCLSAGVGHACLNLTRAVVQPGLWLHWSLTNVPLSGFQGLLPERLQADGRLDGNGFLHWLDGNIADADSTLLLNGAHLATAGNTRIDLQPSLLQLSQSAGQLHGKLELRADQGSLSADLTAAPAARLLDRPLSGRFALDVPDLGFVQPFSRELRAIGGRVDGHLGFAGTLGRPKLDGALNLHDGHAQLATPGIQVTDAQLRLAGNGAGPLALDGSLSSGGGTLTLDGSFDPSTAPPRLDLHLGGKAFQAVSQADARIWVTPDLHLVSTDDGAELSGSLTVPKADITPQGFGGDSGVSASSDQVLVGEQQQAAPQPALRVSAKVRFALGDAVHFQGFGLTTRLEGAVNVNEDPRHGTTGTGELRLAGGRYKAYGQELTIERGRLIFDGGPITAPGIDFSAYKQPQADVKVGVRARGSLEKPLLSLYSDPAMAREQQLSWLLFGRPLEQNTTADRSMVSAAAMSLGLSGGEFLMEQIGSHVGIDSISVGSSSGSGSEVATDASRIAGSQASYGAGSTGASSQSAQLTLGKYLTPRIFVSYGVNLFQPGQTFRLLYDIGHGFKLQTETGAASGGDLIYSIDRGK